MSSNPLWAPLTGASFFAPLEQALRDGDRGSCLTGLVEGSRALLLNLLTARAAGPFLVVVPDDSALEAYDRDLSAFAALLDRDPKRIVVLPALDADPYDGIAPHPEVCRERVVALDRLSRGTLDLLLVPVRALLHPLPTMEQWQSWTRVIRRGDEL